MNEDPVTPEEEPILPQVPEEIQPIEAEGLHFYPTKSITTKPPQKVVVPEAENKIDDNVSTAAVLWTGLQSLMAAAIILTKGETPMGTTDEPTVVPATKKWYTSKTLWVNGLTMAWYFIGPLVGIPILSAEVTGVLLTGANILLRALTKTEVVIS